MLSVKIYFVKIRKGDTLIDNIIQIARTHEASKETKKKKTYPNPYNKTKELILFILNEKKFFFPTESFSLGIL